jgi:adenylylsulfate kinase
VTQNVFWQTQSVSAAERERANGHSGAVVWFTGLSASGKSTLAQALDRRLFDAGCHTFVLDGDNVRHGLCADLGFTAADRHENIRRVGETAKLLAQAGIIALSAFISPYRDDRDSLRRMIGAERFVEVYCRCPLEICERRDRKDLYRRARAGEIEDFTGISAPYEASLAPDVVLDTGTATIDGCVAVLLSTLNARGIVHMGTTTTG